MVTRASDGIDNGSEYGYRIGEITHSSNKNWVKGDFTENIGKLMQNIVEYLREKIQNNDKKAREYRNLLYIISSQEANFHLLDHSRSTKFNSWKPDTTSGSKLAVPTISIKNSKQTNRMATFSLLFAGKVEKSVYDFVKEILPDIKRWQDEKDANQVKSVKKPTTSPSKVPSVRGGTAHKVHDTITAQNASADQAPQAGVPDPSASTTSVDSAVLLSNIPPQEQKAATIVPSSMMDPMARLVEYLKIAEEDAPPKSDANIPEYIIATILRQSLQYPGTITIDRSRGIYFVPDTTMRGLFDSNNALNLQLTKDYLSEKTIVDNLYHAIEALGGTFVPTLRLNVDKFNKKKADSSSRMNRPGEREVVQLIAEEEVKHPIRIDGKNLAFIKHHALTVLNDLLEEAQQKTHLKTVYGMINEGDMRSDRTMIKGFCIIIPGGFDLNQRREIENVDITELKNILRDLSKKRDALSDQIQKKEDEQSRINQKIGGLDTEIQDLSDKNKIQTESIQTILNRPIPSMVEIPSGTLTIDKKIQQVIELIERLKTYVRDLSLANKVIDVSLEREIQSKKDERESTEAALDKIEDDLSGLRVTLEEVKTQYSLYIRRRDEIIQELASL